MVALTMAADPQADAWFRTAVITTGIYCRPSCRARKPRPDNILFFPSGVEARQAGYRPCKRCKPDDAHYDRNAAVVERAREWFDSAADDPDGLTVRTMARALRLSERHLRRVFRERLAVTPKTFLTGLALAQAVHLLGATDRPVIDVALDVGYGSLSTFTRAFRRAYGISPSAYRAKARRVR